MELQNITALVPTIGTLISYSINVFCGIKVVKFVRIQGAFNPRAKELNQQLTKSLIFLVCLLRH
jgi:hypothetical protein